MFRCPAQPLCGIPSRHCPPMTHIAAIRAFKHSWKHGAVCSTGRMMTRHAACVCPSVAPSIAAGLRASLGSAAVHSHDLSLRRLPPALKPQSVFPSNNTNPTPKTKQMKATQLTSRCQQLIACAPLSATAGPLPR